MGIALTSGKVLSHGEDEAQMGAKAAGTGFFTRFFAAIVAARQAQADREIARYIHLTGHDPRQ